VIRMTNADFGLDELASYGEPSELELISGLVADFPEPPDELSEYPEPEVIDSNIHPRGLLRRVRESKLAKIGACVVVAGVIGHIYVGYEAGRAGNILRESGTPTGHDAGKEAAKVFVSQVSDAKTLDQFFELVTDKFDTLNGDQKHDFILGLAALALENNESSNSKKDIKSAAPKKTTPTSAPNHPINGPLAMQPLRKP
jgi:hypothetical protein